MSGARFVTSCQTASAKDLRRARIAWASIGAVVLLAIWLVYEPYQSHYVSALRLLGDVDAHALLGAPKEGRGDEWSTYLPMLKQAYLEGFSRISPLDPYHEYRKWFIALPQLDASILFLPNHLAYWILPAGKALSLQGIFYNLLLLGSCFWLLRNLRVQPALAASAAVALCFSHFYQVWWTSNFPSLGASLLPFAIVTSRLREAIKWPLLLWALSAMLFGQMYPPFYFSLAVAIGPFLLAARPDLLRVRTLLLSGMCCAGALAAYALLNWEYVNAVANTIYPGSRASTGGGSSSAMLLAVLFPTFPPGVEPHFPGPIYEASVAGTFFPLILASVLPFVRWDRESLSVTLVTCATSLMLCIYAISGFPEWLAKITGFTMMPGRRAHFGLSVLVLLFSVFMVARHVHRVRVRALLISCLIMALVGWWSGVSEEAQRDFFAASSYAYMPLCLAVLGFGYATALNRSDVVAKTMVMSIVAGMAVMHVAVFGSFNPIMRGSQIMEPVDTQLTRDLRALLQKAGGEPFAVVGNYGHVLRGEGLPMLEAIHLVNVDRDVYRRVFPMLSEEELESLFNHFRGISFDNVPHYQATGLTAVFPIDRYGVAFDHTVHEAAATAETLLSGIEIVAKVPGPAGVTIYWKSTLRDPLSIDEPLELTAACPMTRTFLTRFPTGGPLLASGESLRGIAGRATFGEMTEAEAEACAASIMLAVPVVVDAVDEGSVAMLQEGRADAMSWSGKACDLSYPSGGGEVAASRGTPVTLTGFVVGPDDAPANNLHLMLRGARDYSIPAKARRGRPDVATYFNNPRLETSGFGLSTTLSTVPPGVYDVHFSMVLDGREYFCDSGRRLRVEGPG